MGVEIVAATTSASARRWKPYPAYKDSGVEWLGEVPKEWEMKRLKWIFRVVNGSTPKSGVSEYWDGDIAWITPDDLGNLQSDTIKETARKITELGYHSCGTTLVPAGSLVLSTRAPIGHLAIADIDLCTNQGCRALVFMSNDAKRFFYYQLLAARPELESWGQGSTFKELGKSNLEAIELVSPPSWEQSVITSFLDLQTAHLDALISKKERLIALLEEKRAALISSAVTKGLDPNAPMKDSGVEWLGEVPEHWKVKRLKYIAPVSNKKLTEKPEELLYLGLEQVESKTGHLLLDVMVENVESVVNVFYKGDVLFGKLRPYLAKVVYADFQGVCTSELLVLNPDSSLDGKFLFYRLISDDFINLINSMTYGTKMPRASSEQISNTSVPLPPLPEQRAIVSFLDRETTKIDALIAKIHDGIEKLREYSTTLISAAVTGKIDVREVV